MNDNRATASLLSTHENAGGLNIFTACLFIVGEIAGTGILALPEAVKSTGWFGVLAIIIVCCASAFAGVLLGKCWLLLELRDASLALVKTRNAYSLIGSRAFGSTGKWFAMTSQTIQLFGGAIVDVLLFAEIAQRLFSLFWFHLTFCEWVVISGLIMLPFSFAGSPVDFWPIAITAMSSTAIASIFIIIAIIQQNDLSNPQELSMTLESGHHFEVTPRSFFLGLSTTVYAFSGAAAMPTIHNDMKNKRQFTGAIILAFAMLLVIYLPVSIVGYIAFGDAVQSNVMRHLTSSPLVVVTDILIAVHVFSSYLILLNPVNLNVEAALNIHHSFNWPRCFSRTIVSAIAILIALSIPKFGQLLNLVGATAVCLQSFILPCFFYYRLSSDSTLGVVQVKASGVTFEEDSHRFNPVAGSSNYSSIACNAKTGGGDDKLSTYIKVIVTLVMVASIVLAISGTYFSLIDVFDPQAFTLPCFICNMDHL